MIIVLVTSIRRNRHLYTFLSPHKSNAFHAWDLARLLPQTVYYINFEALYQLHGNLINNASWQL